MADIQHRGKCETCRFWQANMTSGDRVRSGLCHRFPPTGAQWAETRTDGWCGEYAAKSEEVTKPEGFR